MIMNNNELFRFKEFLSMSNDSPELIFSDLMIDANNGMLQSALVTQHQPYKQLEKCQSN